MRARVAVDHTVTSWSAARNGSGLNRVPLTTLNIVALVPMPSARQMTASADASGARVNARSAMRVSRIRWFIVPRTENALAGARSLRGRNRQSRVAVESPR